MRRRALAIIATLGIVATGPACASKNKDKLHLEDTLDLSAHSSGVFRYSDETLSSPLFKGYTVSVRGLVEDDFRFKARLSVDSQDVFDEVVNDDALAVRFIEPKFIPNFTGKGANRDTLTQLGAHYWVRDDTGAPPIGDAAVADQVLGVDPIVDSLSVVDYVKDAIAQAVKVQKFNAERIDYRPLEDPFPHPEPGSGVTRWDLVPPKLPLADASDLNGQSDANLARVAVFRKMAIYVEKGRVVQIREQISADFDLLDQFRGYIERLIAKTDPKALARAKAQINAVANDRSSLRGLLNIALNQQLLLAGQEPIRFRTMKYEFSRQGEKFHADLPIGVDVKRGSLDFFGANAAKRAADEARANGGAAVGGPTSTTTPSEPASTTTTSP